MDNSNERPVAPTRERLHADLRRHLDLLAGRLWLRFAGRTLSTKQFKLTLDALCHGVGQIV
jgi:hypothetical protein